ncbi:DUF262 domain-containing protein [Pedobacter sp. BMA]|uniref:DUF262 domain-containing protein n=1 Tax=Pedobacter sp. BMA TaxID=1663685 RepID=UPI00064A682C|nr:DUF262 domain-containing protein [Pedobacter sp. BMA]KLT66465.1 hypothetical protein AB669_04530 [Pedobacter sp. BMA]
MSEELDDKNEDLIIEIETVRKEIKTDNFSMALRELVQIYRDGDLELFPNYQRLFRWEEDQKSRYIESLLMGIPTPPIFIAQKKGSKWTIVDGLQRVSTILQVMGFLQPTDTNGNLKAPFKFTKTEKLPSIEGLDWETLHESAKRIIKMSKLDLKIILVEDNVQAQYELFKRLNTGAVVLEPQEIRNCLIIMLDDSFYTRLDELKNYANFRKCLKLTEAKKEIEFPTELILRYFIAKHNHVDYTLYNSTTDLLSDFLDKETINLIGDDDFNLDEAIVNFKLVFDLLSETLGEDSFKKFNPEKGGFDGAFLQSSFEAITPGLSNNIDYYAGEGKALLRQKVIDLYSDERYLEYSARGRKAITRINNMTKFSIDYFSKYES